MKPLYLIGWLLSWTIARLIFRAKVFNRKFLPVRGPFILASNHKSVADPQLVGSSVNRALHFMAKKELFENKFFGMILRRVNAHPLNRAGFDRTALETAIKVLKSGQPLIIFPEGTRARNTDFLPVRPGIGKIARSAMVPVVPAYVSGSDDLKKCFWGKKRLNVIFGPEISTDKISEFGDDKDGYRQLSKEIMNRIKDLKSELEGRVN